MANWVSPCLSCESPQTLRRLCRKESACVKVWRKMNLLLVLLWKSWGLSCAAGKVNPGPPVIHPTGGGGAVVSLLCDKVVVFLSSWGGPEIFFILITLFWVGSAKFWLIFLGYGGETTQCNQSSLCRAWTKWSEHLRPGCRVTPLGSTSRTWPGQGTRLTALFAGHVPCLGEGREGGNCSLEKTQPSL